jgi:hypothetical protein
MHKRFPGWTTPRALIFAALAAATISAAASCSVYMESTRPTPVDMSQFDPGQTRDSVLERLGAPQDTITESDGSSCDVYELYTHGYGAGGKIPIAIAEGAADVVTLGLAEVLLTPTEGVTKNAKHPVTFCYKDQKIVRITGDGASQTGEASAVTAAESDRARAPSASPSAQLSPVAAATPAAAAGATSAAAASPAATASPAVLARQAATSSPASAPTAASARKAS